MWLVPQVFVTPPQPYSHSPPSLPLSPGHWQPELTFMANKKFWAHGEILETRRQIDGKKRGGSSRIWDFTHISLCPGCVEVIGMLCAFTVMVCRLRLEKREGKLLPHAIINRQALVFTLVSISTAPGLDCWVSDANEWLSGFHHHFLDLRLRAPWVHSE